ncbi:MAG: hypothetical protein C7B46_17285 [Sulfobacillus benefaciens]|uniref:Uncharacterized protein n=1 Tax=Sulfobacillus benefaciens TaxID=453960 RepID=A0A2T2X9C5_9FIRM|nr:MAG: hypothetical protein C7B46_17285 [Sulfobacillus benefaciens]
MMHKISLTWRWIFAAAIVLIAVGAWLFWAVAASGNARRDRPKAASTPGYDTITVHGIRTEEALLMTGEPTWLQQRWIIDGRPPLYWSQQSRVYYFSPTILNTAYPNGMAVYVSAPFWWDPLSAPITGAPLTLQVPTGLTSKLSALLNGP